MNKSKLFGGIVAVLIGAGLIMPAVAQLRMQGALPAQSVALLLLGVFLLTGGGGAVARAVRVRSR